MPDKQFLYVNRKAPYGTAYALESLEVVLIAAAFEQPVTLAFLDDGVYQLLRQQWPDELGMKRFAATFHALADYDVTALYVEQESLTERGLQADDLMALTYEDDNEQIYPSITLISREKMTELMQNQEIIYSF